MTIDELDIAIGQLEHAVAHISPEDCGEFAFLAGLYDQLADLCFSKYELTEADEDLEASRSKSNDAAALGRQAVQTSSPGSAETAQMWAILASRLDTKHKRFGKRDDLDDAIECYEKALGSLTVDPNLRSAILINQANCLCTRYEAGGSEEDIEQAISKAEDSLTGEIDTDAATIYNDLSTMYLSRFERKGSLEDLKEAVRLAEKSKNMTAGDHPSLALRLSNLGNGLCTQYECSGQPGDIRSAISALQEADDISSRSDDPNRPQILSNLARALDLRYLRTGIASDLFSAINKLKEALNISRGPFESNVQPTILSNLASFLHAYSEETRDPEDLQAAIHSGEAALEVLPAEHQNTAMCLHNLGQMMKDKYERPELGANSHDLFKAIEYAERATAFKDINAFESAKYYDGLSALLHLQYVSSKSIDCLNDAISNGKRAVHCTTPDLPDHADYLNRLGDMYVSRYELREDDEDFHEAASAFSASLQMETATPASRIKAGQASAFLHQACQHWSEASDSLERAVALIPTAAGDALEQDNQQRVLRDWTSMSVLAASLALQAGKNASRAFEILEMGRGVIASLVIHSEADITRLRTAGVRGSQLCTEYENLRNKVSKPVSSGWLAAGYTVPTDTLISQRLEDVKRLKCIEDEVRQLPGLERFRLSLTEEQLKGLAKDHAIVAFAVTVVRSDAFLITKEGVKSLELKALKFSDFARHVRLVTDKTKLGNLDLRTFAAMNQEMRDLLLWLWDVAVRPVLEALKLYRLSVSIPTSRIHWLTSGAMGLMPLHAAGHHDGHSRENTLSYVISSYATNTKALAWAMERSKVEPWTLGTLTKRVVVVGMPETPGEANLMIDDEFAAVKNLSSGAIVLRKPSCEEVLRELPSATVAHFACHGESNRSDPSNGCLLLYDRKKDVVDLLTVRALALLPLSRARLAYLSACKTADNSALELLDETIHLASSFQLAGYQNVVGTLWKADSEASTQVAHAFYQHLSASLESERSSRDGYDVALALHKAVIAVREDDPDEPISWAPFVHFGG